MGIEIGCEGGGGDEGRCRGVDAEPLCLRAAWRACGWRESPLSGAHRGGRSWGRCAAEGRSSELHPNVSVGAGWVKWITRFGF